VHRNFLKDYGKINFERVQNNVIVEKYKGKEFKLVGKVKIDNQFEGSGHLLLK